MKRIQAACLEQTIHFLVKEEIPRQEAVQMVKTEYEHYRQQLDRQKAGYQILEETAQPDGSLTVKLKRQYNSYPVGDYLS